MRRRPRKSPLFPSPTLSRSGCNEVYRPQEPCHCERVVLRRAPPLARAVGPACADSQHYACPRFLPTSTGTWGGCGCRSEEHTSELQSQSNLVCRLLLEKKKQ